MMKPIVPALILLCSACSHEGVPPAIPQSAPVVAQTRPQVPAADSKSPTRGVVNISEDIRRACGIADSEAYFPFDSSTLTDTDKPVLSKLVTCFKTGPLAGHEMRLVGHADPRGGDDYNMVLGGSRADTVKSFLVMRGLPSNRVATTSRGELDAR